MKKNLIAVAFLGACLSGVLAAQVSPPSRVGVIQVQAALVATKEGQKAAAELDTKMSPRKKDLEAKQNEIKELQEKLQKGGNTLADSAKEELTRSIDQKTKSFNREVEDAQAELEAEQQKLLNVLGQKMMQVIDKYAVANGFAVILDVSNQNTPVLYASNQVDITKEIIDLYDKTMAAGGLTPAATKPAAPSAAPGAAPAAAPAAPRPATAAPKPAAPPAATPTKQ